MLAAIEIYNKPQIAYRDECFVILLLNAWELVLKALLSRNGHSIYYHKRRGQPYKTYALDDALANAEALLPAELSRVAVRRNLELLATFRDNAIHFYNKPGFGVLIYALAQQSILNYVALLSEGLGDRFAKHVTWHLLPLGLATPIDPVEYMTGASGGEERKSPAVSRFIAEIARAAQEVEESGGDSAQLITTFKVTLLSVKKIAKADAVVGVQPVGEGAPLAIVRRADPNETHPLTYGELMRRLGDPHPTHSTGYVFQALNWKHGLKADERYCWTSAGGGARQFSHNLVAFIKKLSAADIEAALEDYREHLRKKRREKP